MKNYFQLINLDWNKENYHIEERRDPDSDCKELYEDLANVLLDQRILPNGNTVEIYEKSKLVIGEKNSYYETRVNIQNNNKVLYKIGLGTDCMGASINWAVQAGCCAKECLDIIKISRTLGGHIFFPRWIIDCQNNEFLRGVSLNKSKGGGKGFYDRMDLFLFDLSLWYKSHDCKLKTSYEKNRLWLEQFVDIEGFIKFFKLESFVHPKSRQIIDFTKKDKWIFNNEAYIPRDIKEYKLFANNINNAIEKRSRDLINM